MLILWFKMFTPIVVKNDAEWTAKMHKEGTKLYVPFDLEAGDEKPFFELAKENKEAEPLDFEGLLKLVTALGKRIEKKVEDGEVVPEDVETAKSMARTIEGLRFARVETAKETPEATNDESQRETETAAA